MSAGRLSPGDGMYELLNIMGTPMGPRVLVSQGEALPPAPFGLDVALGN
jgi:hypothetical protein